MYHLPAAEFRTPVASCCGALPAIHEFKALYEFPELKKRVNVLGTDFSEIVYYRCALCGQVWEEHRESAMHADVYFLLKSEVNPDGTLVRVGININKLLPERIQKFGLVEKIEP